MNRTAPADDSIVYLNGEFLPLSRARISPLDRGFIFGDGVYEVIPVYARRIFRLDDHMSRLERSLEGIRLANPYSRPQWGEIISELVRRSPHEDQSVYLQITRGAAKRDHAFPIGVAPTVFLMTGALSVPTQEAVDAGVVAATMPDNRWLRCDLKTIALLPNVLLRQEAIDAGAVEAVLLRDGWLTEGAASNIFVVVDGVLLTPPKSNLMLPGITYDVILELAAAHSMRCEVRPVSEAELRSAQEVWLTSSTREVLAITRLDGKAVGDGRPGPLFRRMHGLFQQFKEQVKREPQRQVHA